MLILAIETSCDETSLALVVNGSIVLGLETAGQEVYHQAFGGVVPELAARRHLEVFYPTLSACLRKACAASQYPNHLPRKPQALLRSVAAIAVTTNPGLQAALFVGLSAAKSLSYLLDKPLIPIDHLKAHFYSLAMSSPALPYPYIGLLVSGGHSILAKVTAPLAISVLGCTLDDAAGECFDKIARHLGLPYPGGAALEQLAATGNANAFVYPIPKLSAAKLPPFNFSYSGLKTAVIYNSARYAVKPLPKSQTVKHARQTPKPDIAASFQHAACKQLVQQTVRAMHHTGIHHVGICGGVAANHYLQTLMRTYVQKEFGNQASCHSPPLNLCGDNAAMIGGLAFHAYKAGQVAEAPFKLLPAAQSFKHTQTL